MRRPHLLLLLLLPFLVGCFGPGGTPLSRDELDDIRYKFEEIDRIRTEDEVKDRLATLREQLAPIADSKDPGFRAEAARLRLERAYCWERIGDFTEAQSEYGILAGRRGGGCAPSGGSKYGPVVYFRLAQIVEYERTVPDSRSDPERLRKQARGALEQATRFPVGTETLIRRPPVGFLQPGVWDRKDILYEAYSRLDEYYRDALSYRIFSALVRFCGGDKNYSYVLAIVLIALIAKLITTPLSAAQFRSMQAMQAVQPELKKLQQKYKDDKQQMARAQMELFKAHKVNPASSCLPMLIQMPILIWVYYGIRHFVFQFWDVSFLYIHSLAHPDAMPGAPAWPGPLVLLYGVSMYFSQKLIATPAATPEQQQQQKLMAYMMPVLLVVILKGLPAAFILYWLLQNILMTGHQYLIMRRRRTAEAAAIPGPAPAPSTPAPAPPPEALDKLSQGTRPRRKKKKRR
jgi:YidC/Oxa1 family membrane protein insertase